jgi:glycosyltransferase involved in cell wall biosynthesis
MLETKQSCPFNIRWSILKDERENGMRILYVHGINQVAKTYGKYLANQGHIVSLYEPSLAGGNSPLPIKLALMPGRLFDLRNVVGQLDTKFFDLAHIHWASYGVLGLISRIPFIVECHGSDVRYRLQQPFLRSLLTPVLQRATAVLCITPDLLPVVQSVRPDALFLPGPLDTDQFAPLADNQGDRSDPWTVLLFTRLDPIKGPEIAVEGIERFTRRHPEVRVQLLDWGLLKREYKRRYGDRFEFLVPVVSQEVRHLLRSADVIVGQCNLGILSFCELQAMSCAKPVICSFRYDDAYPTPPPLFRASTAEEIDEHLENLFQHPEVGVALGQKSREWVIENHDHRVLAGRLEELYRTII